MAIFRGDGGAGDSNTDAMLSLVTEQAVIATTKASESAVSASGASTAATTATTKASEAATSAAAAANSATGVADYATAAAASATESASSASDASTSATAAAASASDASGALANAVLKTNNLSDLASASTARSNLGLGTVATTAASAYATAAQGTTADAALPKTGGTVSGALILNGTGSLKLPVGTTAQRPTGAAGQFRYNTTEGAFEGYTTEWGSIGGGAADLTLNSFTGDGSDVTFSLSAAAIENNTLVYVDGVYQNKSTYAVSAATPAVVTFSEAPSNGAAIEIMVAAISVTDIGTPSDNTVTTAKIVNDAVTTAKIVDGAVTSAKLGAGVGGAFNDFSVKTTAYTAVTRDQLIVNSSSAVTITLPASPSAGNVVFIKNAGSGTVTVARNGSNINSTADNGSLAADAGASLVYVDSTIGWKEL